VAGDKIEPEANAFASALLIPRARLRRAADAGLTVDELRQLFDVSREALHWALDDARLLSRFKA
jgi:Zn-dependent peptidase ImmA (M78 family)